MKPMMCLLICLLLALHSVQAQAEGIASLNKKMACEPVFLSVWKNEVPASPAMEICGKHPWVKQLSAWLDTQMSQEDAEILLISPTRQFETPKALQHAEKMVAAAVLARSGKTIEARHLWTTLTVEKPKWGEPWFNLGLLNLREGDGDEAKRCFQRGSEICKQHLCRVEPKVWDLLLLQLENAL
ncbi:MAG: hypothetical protein LW629_06595 [Burkholderiales bacterium]|nr:hypothetical protein [Burkholderiales bacterium]